MEEDGLRVFRSCEVVLDGDGFILSKEEIYLSLKCGNEGKAAVECEIHHKEILVSSHSIFTSPFAKCQLGFRVALASIEEFLCEQVLYMRTSNSKGEVSRSCENHHNFRGPNNYSLTTLSID